MLHQLVGDSGDGQSGAGAGGVKGGRVGGVWGEKMVHED